MARTVISALMGILGRLASVSSAKFFFQAEDGIRDCKVTGVPDVCSSDLSRSGGGRAPQRTQRHELGIEALVDAAFFLLLLLDEALLLFLAAAVFIELAAQGSGGLGRVRSGERRVGEEGRSRWSPDH